MKKYLNYCASALALMALSACSDTFEPSVTGEGSVMMTASINTDMEVVSRAASDELAGQYGSSLVVYIRNSQGVVRQYRGADNLPTAPISLLSGHYTAQGWAGDSVSASWTERCFKGSEEFDITNGAVSTVALALKVANTAAELELGEGVQDVLTDIQMTVGHSRGTLTFTEENLNDRAYFMFPSYDRNLRYTLSGKLIDGTPIELADVIENPAEATCYRFKVVYTPKENNNGGAFFTISVDESSIEVRNEIELTTAPSITGYDFDINSTITGEKGKIGRRTFYVTTAATLRDVILTSDDLTPILGSNAIDFLNLQDETAIETLAAAGINFHSLTKDVNGNTLRPNQLVQLNLEEALTNNLEDGIHIFTLQATDIEGRQSTGTLTINVSNAPVEADPIDPDDLRITSRSAVLTGTVLKEGVEEVGFRYRAQGGQWNYIAGVPESRSLAVGTRFAAVLTGLTPATTYEYLTVSDNFESTDAMTFTTEAEPQLPNSSFEEWSTSGKTVLLAANANNLFWDSGNHGSSTMSKNITDKSTQYVHSGTYSAQLTSQFVGVGSIGKFAAGNAFVGKYLKTDGTDGVLGWGRPFTARPKAFRIWIKYNPGTVQKKGAVSGYLNEGDQDQGAIYMALVDGTVDTYDGQKWPAVIKTKASERKLFNPEGENVIAYGAKFLESATDGDGLIELVVPLTYRRNDTRPAALIFVASASRYGDYFCGGEGSTLWIDDIELIYE